MKPNRSCSASLLRLLLVHCCASLLGLTVADPKPPELRQSIGRFSQTLFTALQPPAHTDCIISPFSVLADLAMTWFGARHSTAAELQRALQLSDRSRDQVGAEMRQLLQPLQSNTSVLRIANRIYVQQSQRIRAAFNQRVEHDFFARAQPLNFGQSAAAAGEINRFVADITRGVIRQLVDASSLSASTQMVLINAVYFKGVWQRPFHKRNTHREPFYVNGDAAGDSVSVEFMHQTERLLYAELPELEAVIVGLPYENDDFRLHVILPNAVDSGDAGGRGLAQLTGALGAGNWDLSVFRSRMDWARIRLSLPKFQTRYRASLSAELQKVCVWLFDWFFWKVGLIVALARVAGHRFGVFQFG